MYLGSVQRVSHKLEVGACKVVVYNYFFVGFNSVPNLIVIMFNLLYPIFYVGVHCMGCV